MNRRELQVIGTIIGLVLVIACVSEIKNAIEEWTKLGDIGRFLYIVCAALATVFVATLVVAISTAMRKPKRTHRETKTNVQTAFSFLPIIAVLLLIAFGLLNVAKNNEKAVLDKGGVTDKMFGK